MKLLICGLCLFACLSAPGQVPVTTSQYNTSRTGSNSKETQLTPSNVRLEGFGKLFSLRVDGDVYAQPLYLPNLEITGKGRHNVLFVATEHDSVYAFDADSKAEPLWRSSFTDAGKGITTLDAREVHCPFINPEIGITATPVIDPGTQTIYVLARTKEGSQYVQRLHALDVASGQERSGSPAKIDVSLAAGAFDPLLENPRSSLLLSHGIVYLTWGSSCDVGNYHGWVMAYDAQTLHQKAVFNTSPDSKESGIWQSDTGPVADDAGNVYVVTGNGKFDVPAGRDYGDTILKLALDKDQLLVRDYFTPHNQAELSEKDDDLGSGGPILLPDQKGVHPHVLLIGGKDGNLFVVDADRMGHYNSSADDVVQTVKLKGRLHAAPAYWNQHVYVWGDSDVLHELAVRDGKLASAHDGSMGPVDPGATPTVSANGDRNAIVWTVTTRTWEIIPEKLAVLHAYDAADVSRELYSSEQNSDRDRAGISVRFTIPTVINGRVYVGARGEVDVYGLLSH